MTVRRSFPTLLFCFDVLCFTPEYYLPFHHPARHLTSFLVILLVPCAPSKSPCFRSWLLSVAARVCIFCPLGLCGFEQLLIVLLDHGKPPLPVVISPAGPDGDSAVRAHVCCDVLLLLVCLGFVYVWFFFCYVRGKLAFVLCHSARPVCACSTQGARARTNIAAQCSHQADVWPSKSPRVL